MSKEISANIVDEKEVDSMNIAVDERTGYKRLNFNALNFTNNENTKEKNIEDISPIKWSKEVLSGEKQVIIKKK